MNTATWTGCTWCDGPRRVLHCDCRAGILVRMYHDWWPEIGFKKRLLPATAKRDDGTRVWPMSFDLIYPKPARPEGERPSPWPEEVNHG